jgi:hypothetical protein
LSNSLFQSSGHNFVRIGQDDFEHCAVPNRSYTALSRGLKSCQFRTSAARKSRVQPAHGRHIDGVIPAHVHVIPTTMTRQTMRGQITAFDLERTALIYVRQSTPGQVQDQARTSSN